MLQFGVIVLTTANGILDHEEARRKKVGGKVLGRGIYFPDITCSVTLHEMDASSKKSTFAGSL